MSQKPRYTVSKTFGHDLGLSCAFRQHAAQSHCSLIHGYALAFTLEIGSNLLDLNGWCFDFGSFGPVREFLRQNFDHVLIVAHDDPHVRVFERLEALQLAHVLYLPRVGCEAFARYVHEEISPLISTASENRAWLISTTVSEHGANSVTFTPSNESE